MMARVRRDHPLDERFDAVVISCEVGLSKPDPRIYQLCLDRLGLAARVANLGNSLPGMGAYFETQSLRSPPNGAIRRGGHRGVALASGFVGMIDRRAGPRDPDRRYP
jgi:hypothetical protein